MIDQDVRQIQHFIHPNGTKMYMLGGTTSTIYQYVLVEINQPTSAIYSACCFDFSAQDVEPESFIICPNGYTLNIFGGVSQRFYKYTFSEPWEVSSLTYDSF